MDSPSDRMVAYACPGNGQRVPCDECADGWHPHRQERLVRIGDRPPVCDLHRKGMRRV